MALSDLYFLQVGTQTDLRDNAKRLQELSKQNLKPISYEMGVKRASKLGASGYKECSAVTMEGIKDVFDEAIRTILFPQTKHSDKKHCIVS